MLQYLDSKGEWLYDVFTIYVSSSALLAYNLTRIRAKRRLLSTVSQTILERTGWRIGYLLAFVEIVLISLYQHGLVSILNQFLGAILFTGANYYGLIYGMPFLLPLLCWAIGVDPRRQIDLITPAYPVALFFMKLGCFCAGCCGGRLLASPFMGFDRIPMQLVEAGVALVLFVFLLVYKRKAEEGTLFPVYIVLYSAIRFFTEFFRGERNVFLCFKMYHILSLIGLALGIGLLRILRQRRDMIDRVFENSLPVLLRRKMGRAD